MTSTFVRAFAATLMLACVLLLAGCAAVPPKPTCVMDSSLSSDEIDLAEKHCREDHSEYDAYQHRSLKAKLNSGDRDAWWHVGRVAVPVLLLSAWAYGSWSSSRAKRLAQPPAEPYPQHFAEPPPFTYPPGSASATLLDVDGDWTWVRERTTYVCNAEGLPGALALARIEPRPDGDAEVILARTGITDGQALFLVRDRMLAAWGVRSIRGVGTSRDGLFQVTVTNAWSPG